MPTPKRPSKSLGKNTLYKLLTNPSYAGVIRYAYARTGDTDRRLACQAFYTRLDITDDEQLRPRLAEPFATIIREAHEHSDAGGEEPLREHDTPTQVACSRKTLWVDLRRDFENTGQAHREVYFRWSTGYYEAAAKAVRTPVRDSRGPIVGAVGKVQTLLTPAQVGDLVASYKGGATTTDISERFGIHRRTVVLHLHRQGVPLRRGGIAHEQGEEATRQYQSGMSLAAIAARFSTSPHTIRRALLSRDVEMRTAWQHMQEPVDAG